MQPIALQVVIFTPNNVHPHFVLLPRNYVRRLEPLLPAQGRQQLPHLLISFITKAPFPGDLRPQGNQDFIYARLRISAYAYFA
jgi:hypothetical protein